VVKVSTVVGHELAKESTLRGISAAKIGAARKNLHVAYWHTSHGTHVSYGLYGLPGYKDGDGELFGITEQTMASNANKLDFHDYYGSDLSTTGDSDWNGWLSTMRSYLDDSANSGINAVMWSWCSISGHNVPSYLSSMQTLIDEYGVGGSKIGTGKTRTIPVSFIFMTGHAEAGDNVGAGKPRDQAKLITDYCSAHGYWCLDYYSIDSHDMDGNYYEDSSDDAYSASAGKHFNQVWQDAHAEGKDWFYNQSAPGGTSTGDYGAHLSQHITANRKAYAMWYILAGIAAERGFTE
jgi:hypothetical protein